MFGEVICWFLMFKVKSRVDIFFFFLLRSIYSGIFRFGERLCSFFRCV